MSVSDINTKVLMHMNESTFKDEVGHNVTNTSGVTLNSTTKKFGAGSAYFNGTSYLSVENSTDFQFGSSDFTIDAWVNLGTVASGSEAILYYKRKAVNSFSNMVIAINSSRQINVAISSNNSTWDILNAMLTAVVLDVNIWYHIAIIRNGNNFYASINGKLYLLGTSSLAISNNTANISVGGVPGFPLGYFYMDEFRISNSARWTSDFIPNVREYGTILRYLIQDGTELKTINGSNLVTICNTTDDSTTIENSFLTSGLDNLALWSNSLTSQINNSIFKVAIYRKDGE